MLSWALTFFVIPLLGFSGIAGAASGIDKTLFLVFLLVFVISLVAGRRGSAPL